eukprot:TRINITY_DN2685_c0_g1_i1.p1 TRINITY_DN2685_c0_g1~~TRINITY_DN2685_c0_g1_i1.p1  ORF type:complete len:307 (+),score=52.89 TRINITY_DN2685_c0_g1_i1:122-1042(+)
MATTLSSSALLLLRHQPRLTSPSRRPNLSPPSSPRKCKLYHRPCSYFVKNATSIVSCSQVKLEDGIDDETCELVNGIELTLGEGTDSIRAYLLKAVKNNNGTGVLLLSDVFGFGDSSTRDFAYRVACNGYNVLLPDLFRGNPWTKRQSKTEFENWLTSQSQDRIAKDIATSTKWMVDEFVAAGISKKLGIVGFCFGGCKLIETLARDEQAHFGVGICFYGTQMNPSLASNIQVPVLFVSGENDFLCPVNILHDMENRIKGSRVVIYPGRGHGFAHRPESLEDDEDAEDAFNIMKSWLLNCLVLKQK